WCEAKNGSWIWLNKTPRADWWKPRKALQPPSSRRLWSSINGSDRRCKEKLSEVKRPKGLKGHKERPPLSPLCPLGPSIYLPVSTGGQILSEAIIGLPASISLISALGMARAGSP